MGHITQRVARAVDGLTVAETARRAGVSRSTLNRLIAGEVDPALDTLRELAIVHGLDVAVDLVPLSDPDAANAARVMLEGVAPNGPGSEAWRRRLERMTSGEPLEILATAGHASSLLHRRGAIGLRGAQAGLRLASAGDAARGFWALSAGAMVNLERPSLLRGPSVLWVQNVNEVSKFLLDTHKLTRSLAAANVIIAPADDSTRVGAFEIDRFRFVAPTQLLLDCVGLGGDLEAWAMAEAEEWSR